MEWAALGLTIASAATGAAASYSEAQQRNDAAKRAAKSTRDAAELQTQQVRQAASTEVQRQRLRAARVRAALRVQAAEQGATLDDGSFAAMERQTAIDTQFNRNVTRQNEANQILSILSGGSARLADIESNRTSGVLSAFLGGTQGAGMGLSISSSAQELDLIPRTRA